MSNIESLLSHLHKVKPTGAGRWLACCSSHDDRNRSLAIKYDCGKILLHCFAGCSAHEIVSAVGMDMSDLFPENTRTNSQPARNPFPASDVLRCLQTEAMIVAIVAADIAKGGQLTEARKDRLLVAVGRIEGAYEHA